MYCAARFDLTPYHKQSALKAYFPGGGGLMLNIATAVQFKKTSIIPCCFIVRLLSSLSPPFVVEIEQRRDKAAPFPDSREERE